MIDTISDELIVQWQQQEERDRERIEEQAQEKWENEVEPEQRDWHLGQAEDEWVCDIAPVAREKYITSALDVWDAEADDRRDAYIETATARTTVEVRVVPTFDADGAPVTFDEAGTPMLQWRESWAGYRNVWVCFTEDDSDYHVIGGDERDVEYALTEAKKWLRMKAQESA